MSLCVLKVFLMFAIFTANLWTNSKNTSHKQALNNLNTEDVNTGTDTLSIMFTSLYITWNQKWWMGQSLCTSWKLLMEEDCQSVAPKSPARSCQIWRLHYHCWPLSSLCHYLSAVPPGASSSEWKWWLIIVYDKQTILIQVFLITYAVITQRHNGRKSDNLKALF